MPRPRLRRAGLMADAIFARHAIGATRSMLANVARLAPVEAAVGPVRAHRAQSHVIREGVKAAAETRSCGGHDAFRTGPQIQERTPVHERSRCPNLARLSRYRP